MSGSYGIDHYRPKSLFRDLEWQYSNMFWACHACNSRKGAYWPALGKEAKEFIPNPCDHRMFEHLKVDGLLATARTRAGEVTVELLDLNSTDHRERRQKLQVLVEEYDASRKRCRAALTRVELAQQKPDTKAHAVDLESRRTDLLKRIDQLSEVLEALAAS